MLSRRLLVASICAAGPAITALAAEAQSRGGVINVATVG